MSFSDFYHDAPRLARDWGIHLPHVQHYTSHMIAEDADITSSTPVTANNSGIPALFSTYTDPKIIQALVTPTRSEAIYGIAKKGDWLTDTAQFPVVELSGMSVSYGDYATNGISEPNANWVQRQSYHFQTWTQWGERETARMGAAQIDWVMQKHFASVNILNKTSNKINLFGLSGMALYGALNDPSLPAAIQPTAKISSTGTATGGTSWIDITDPLQIYNDVLKAYQQLNIQLAGNLTLETPMTLVIPTERQQCLLYSNQYRTTVKDLLRENLPNLTIETLPEAGGKLNNGANNATMMQLFAKNIDGQEVVTTAFTEKLRAHAVERYSSYLRQKKSQGTWGTIWYYPAACVTMTGI